MISTRALLGSATVLLLFGVGGAALWRRAHPGAAAHSPPATSSDPMLAQRSRGNPAAPVTVYEFSDFQCPYCRQFWERTLPVLEQEYIATGKIRLTFVNYPIPSLHPNAPEAHNFAMCAAKQNKFWPVHDLLFRHQHEWEKLPSPSGYFRSLADSASLDIPDVRNCMQTHAEDWLVQADSREAGGAGISGTPAFVINGGLLPGAQPIEVWRPIVDSIYRAASKSGNEGKKQE